MGGPSDTSILNHFQNMSSIYFKLYELFIEKLGIKFTPIRLGPYSKTPIDTGWTDPDYNPSNIAWPRHYGNIGIIPGRSNLLIIDCDTEETIQFFKELANNINLPLNTLTVKTRRGAHFYYYCPFSAALEKKQFTDNARNIKIDVLAGNKCQVVAPYSQLKLDAQGNILKPNAEDFILFVYEPINIPEKLPEITPELYNLLVHELEKFLQKTKEIQTITTVITTQDEERELTDEEIAKIVEIIEPHFVEGQRQNLILFLTGFLRKELNVNLESIYKIYQHFETTDDKKDIKARYAAIRKTFEKPLDEITGHTGLVEILGEENASELCTKIKQILNVPTPKTKPKKKKDDNEEFLEQLYEEMQNDQTETQNIPQDYVYIEINRKSKKFARCNYNNLTIEYGAFEKNEFTDKYYYVVHQKIFDFCIQKIYVAKNALTNEKKYEIHVVSNNKAEPYNVFTGELDEIWNAITKKPYVLQPGIGLQILNAVLSHYLAKGWFEEKIEELPPGFYYLNGKIISQGFEEKTYTKENLQKAALFLNEYIYSHPNPLLIASIIRAGILLPFSFAQKQLVMAGKLRKRMKYLFLCGETKSGKTTTAMLLSRIWDINDQNTNKISYASFCTEARAAKHLSNSTHILIVDEVNKDLETSTVKELLKFTQEDIIARIILNKAQKTIHYPALAAIIMTSNSHFPADPALLERFLVFRFRKLDKISAVDRAKYEREDFNKLWPLAQFIWRYIKVHGLRDDYIDYATEILKAAYQEAEVNAEWLGWTFTHDTAETEEEQEYKREAEFFNAVQRFFLQFIKPQEEIDHKRSVYHALKNKIFGRWIWVDDNNFLYISKDFLLELKKYYRCDIRDLEELSELTGWIKKIKRYKNTTLWVVETSIMEFFYRLNYLPRLVNSYEFEEWIANRLKIEPEPELENDTQDLDTLNKESQSLFK